jgi:predicted membrane protein
MAWRMPFIVLIERRRLRPLMLVLSSALVLKIGLGALAALSSQRRAGRQRG